MRVQKWVIILLLIGLVTSTVTVAVSAQKPTAPTSGTASITSPPRNSTVGPNETVSGKAQLPSGYSLWVMPYDGITGKYYPQGSAVTINDEARWSVRLSFSSIAVGQVFQIRAVSADGNANSDLSSYVGSGQKSGTTHLPTGAQAIEAISVTRGTSSSTPSPSASPSMIPIVTQNVSTATPSTSSVVQASTPASSSQSPLPGFEAIFALGALAIAFVLVFKGRLAK